MAEIRTLYQSSYDCTNFLYVGTCGAKRQSGKIACLLQKGWRLIISYTAEIECSKSGDQVFVEAMYKRNMEEFGEDPDKDCRAVLKNMAGRSLSTFFC